GLVFGRVNFFKGAVWAPPTASAPPESSEPPGTEEPPTSETPTEPSGPASPGEDGGTEGGGLPIGGLDGDPGGGDDFG
ncbi:hypothetical protein PV350_42090, partial [Streptomyces sp. PA03-6a]|nr:hypothetical protein [Streptomyces sp. PA03-6a]